MRGGGRCGLAYRRPNNSSARKKTPADSDESPRTIRRNEAGDAFSMMSRSPPGALELKVFFQDANPGQGTCPGRPIWPSRSTVICKEILKPLLGVRMRACGHARYVATVTVMSCWASGPSFLRGEFGGTSDRGRDTNPLWSRAYARLREATAAERRLGSTSGAPTQAGALTTASARTSAWRSRRARHRGAR